MKHVVTTIIPDCPMCGQEMKILGRMAYSKEDGTFAGYRLRQHWECPACGNALPEESGRIILHTTEVTFPIEDAEADYDAYDRSYVSNQGNTEISDDKSD